MPATTARRDGAEEFPVKADPLVSLRSLSKIYGSTKALTDVDFDVRSGEILGLLGANGAGKSTLLNIIGGTVAPTQGQLTFAGLAKDFGQYGPLVARRLGIQRVFQELSMFTNLSVAENFALTATAGEGRSRRRMRQNTRLRLAEVFPGSGISPRAEVGELSLAQQQMVEISRAATEPGLRLLILDEPTSSLSAGEAAQLVDFIRRKADEGLAVIYVTHKLDEVLDLADRLTILRDGQVHWEGDGHTATHSDLLNLLGANVVEGSARRDVERAVAPDGAEEVLGVRAFSSPDLHEISISIRPGEVVGLAGLEGAGQRSLLHQIFAARSRRRGAITVTGDAAYVSGDRQREGILPLWSVAENVGISALRLASAAGFVRRRQQRSIAERWLTELGLLPRAEANITQLSGGNQQRALLSRALASEASLLLLDDPTRGVDVGAKYEIYEILDRVKAEGRSALFYSTENIEFLKCDRVYVMAQGAIVAELSGAEATEERIVEASFTVPDHVRETKPAKASIPAAGNGIAAPSTDLSQGRPGGLARLGKMLSTPSIPAAVLFIAMLVTVFRVQPNTLTSFGLNLLLEASTVLVFAALAQMLFVLGGDIDLGLGYAVGFVNVVAATLLVKSPLLGVLALLALVAGYIVMAVLVEKFAVPSVVVTLGASFVWLGAGLLLQATPGGSSPQWLSSFFNLSLPIPESLIVLVVAALLGLFFVRGWRQGTVLRALGNSGKTLVGLGYSALRARIILYAIASLFVIVTGLLVTASAGGSDIEASSTQTLGSVAAVIVGGASFAGGRVSPVGAVLAAVGLSLINSVLVFAGVNSQYSTAIGGIVLILVLGLRALVGRRAQR
jgi:ribose transport system ATP-binding protein